MLDTDTITALLISALLVGTWSIYTRRAGWPNRSYVVSAVIGWLLGTLTMYIVATILSVPLAAAVAAGTVLFLLVSGCGWAWYLYQQRSQQ